MNRTGLMIALGIAVVTGLLFGFFPDLDLRVARYFFGFVEGGNALPGASIRL